MKKFIHHTKSIALPLAASSLLSVALFICRVLGAKTTRYWFLLWNLFLAWLPLLFMLLLKIWLKKGRWLSPKGILFTLLWLGFLPNSFYLISDLIHLKATGETSLIFDAVLFMSFAWNGLLLGFTSVLMIHSELAKRFNWKYVTTTIAVIFVLCSFAVYLGRYLAWNTWDILINPAGILFDLSDRIVKPGSYPNTFSITTLFTVTLTTMYFTVYKLVNAIRGDD